MKRTINQGRLLCFSALKNTLSELKDKANVTEIEFRDNWLNKISLNPTMTKQGWYSPPPFGMAVLSAEDNKPGRINFQSLRDKENFPSDRIINWETNLIYVYASNIDMELGLAGDFGTTLYFGNNPLVIEHFKNCYQAVKKILLFLEKTNSSVELFNKSQDIFFELGLQNCIVSYTDKEPLDLGHSIPLIETSWLKTKEVNSLTIDFMKNQRKFLNSSVDWDLNAVEQFTIEPRLKVINDKDLPQISFHYLVSKKNSFHVMTEGDSLFQFL
jgi:hypothetical protein